MAYIIIIAERKDKITYYHERIIIIGIVVEDHSDDRLTVGEITDSLLDYLKFQPISKAVIKSIKKALLKLSKYSSDLEVRIS